MSIIHILPTFLKKPKTLPGSPIKKWKSLVILPKSGRSAKKFQGSGNRSYRWWLVITPLFCGFSNKRVSLGVIRKPRKSKTVTLDPPRPSLWRAAPPLLRKPPFFWMNSPTSQPAEGGESGRLKNLPSLAILFKPSPSVPSPKSSQWRLLFLETSPRSADTFIYLQPSRESDSSGWLKSITWGCPLSWQNEGVYP